MRYVKTLVITAPFFTVLYHWTTSGGIHPLPWWPDSFIIGGAMGLLSAFVVLRLSVFIASRRFFRAAVAVLTNLTDRLTQGRGR